MGKMTVQDLATLLVEKNGCNLADAQRFVTAIFDVVQMGIERDKLVKIKGLGTFKVIDVEARESVSVNTGERVLIHGHAKLTFTPDTTMKELVNKPFSGFETVALNEGVNFDDMVPSEAETNDDVEAGIEEKPTLEQPILAEKIQEKIEEPVVDSEIIEEPVVIWEKSDEPVSVQEKVEEALAVQEKTEGPVAVREKIDKPVATPDKAVEAVAAQEKVEKPVWTETKAEPEVVLLLDAAEYEKMAAENEKKNTEENESLESEEADIEDANIEETDIEIAEPEETKPETIMKKDTNPSLEERKIPYGLIIAILACVGSFVAGYFVGRSSMYPDYSIADVIQGMELRGDSVDHVEQDNAGSIGNSLASNRVLNEDSVPAAQPIEEKTVEEKTVAEDPVAEKPAAEKPTAERKTEADSQADYMKYDAMDQRLRFGAYYIMGTSEVVKAKEGETIERISRRILGQGMSCYLEVYNGIDASTPLKAGQEIKIPKIELKKIVKRRLEKNK